MQAQAPNPVDPVFGGASLGLLGKVGGVFLQPDGKLLVTGNFNDNIWVARLNADGSVDPSFSAPVGLELLMFALQPDGKILARGILNGFVDTIVRLNPDGTLDSSFQAGVYDQPSGNEINTAVLETNGQILVGCTASCFRLNADGRVDSSFTPEAGVTGLYGPLSNGQILAAGPNGIVRLNADGTLDPGFDVTSGQSGVLTVQPDGRIIVEGGASNTTYASSLYRLNADGSLDGSFEPVNVGSVAVVGVQSDGKLVIVGGFSSVNDTPEFCLARLNPDGTLDASFSASASGGYQSYGIGSLVMRPDDSFYIGGAFATINGQSRSSVALLSADGGLENTFIPDLAPGPDAPVYAITCQADGSVLLGGVFSSVAGATHSNIVRLKSDGTVDPTFNAQVSTSTYGSFVNSIYVQPNGGVFINGGQFSAVDGVAMPDGEANYLVHLNADGSLDSSFAPTHYEAISLQQSDGKFLVGMYDPFTSERTIVRVNADFTPDPTFNLSVPTSSLGSIIVQQPDGRVLCTSGAYGNMTIICLNTDGSQDLTFAGPTLTGIGSIGVQSDGRIVLDGSSGILRYNTDGSPDSTFTSAQTSTYTNVGSPALITIQSDDKILLWGQFTHVNGVPFSFLARLNADGTLDPFFNAGNGPDGSITSLALDPSGKILIAGYFTMIDGVLRNYVARLTPTGSPDFFNGGVSVGNGFYYLQFPDGTPFGYYNLSGDGYAFPYFYHADLGMEYFYDANDGQSGAYMYDFASNTFFYTSPMFPWPYLYDFSLNTVLYYYPDPSNAGHYNTNGVRYFYNFATGQIITK